MRRDPGEIYSELTREMGDPLYERIDAPATPQQKSILERLSPGDVHVTEVAGEKIEQILTTAPGDGNPIGGIKVTHARTDGSPRALPEPKTSTRFMPRASSARATSGRWKRKLRQLLTRRLHEAPEQRREAEAR